MILRGYILPRRRLVFSILQNKVDYKVFQHLTAKNDNLNFYLFLFDLMHKIIEAFNFGVNHNLIIYIC